MSDYQKKLLGIVDKAFQINEPTFGDKVREFGKELIKGLYTEKKQDNAEKQALQLANSAKTFDSIQRQLDDIYMAFPTEELDKVTRVGEDSFLNEYAEKEFNNMDWSQTTGIKWSDRTNPDKVTREDKIKMFEVYDTIVQNKRNHLERLRQDPRAKMERTEFSQLVLNAKNAEENRIKLNPETKFALPIISKSFDAMFGNGASAYAELEKTSEKAQKELTEFIATLNGLDEKIAFDYNKIINNDKLSAEEKADRVRNNSRSISASSIESQASKIESRLYRRADDGTKKIREEVKEMIKNSPITLQVIDYEKQYDIEDFKKIGPDEPRTNNSFNFYDKFLKNEIVVLESDGTLSTSSLQRFLFIASKNMLERQDIATRKSDESLEMFLGTDGFNNVIASFANEGRFVTGTSISLTKSPTMAFLDNQEKKYLKDKIVFISPSITNRINKDKISVNEIIAEKDEQEPSDNFDEDKFRLAVLDVIQAGEGVEGYRTYVLNDYPQRAEFINKTIDNLLNINIRTTKSNNLAEEIQRQEGRKTIADVERPPIPFPEIARKFGDFFSNLQRETDFENLRDYVEKGDNAVIINRPALFKKYNLPANASPADVQKFLAEQELQD